MSVAPRLGESALCLWSLLLLLQRTAFQWAESGGNGFDEDVAVKVAVAVVVSLGECDVLNIFCFPCLLLFDFFSSLFFLLHSLFPTITKNRNKGFPKTEQWTEEH